MVTALYPEQASQEIRRVEFYRPTLYQKQEEAFFNSYRYSICEASTKSGKTVGGMAWLVEQATQGRHGYNYWWIAPIYAQAKIAFRRTKRSLPKWFYHAKEDELTITLINGAVIWFKGADKPNSLYGEDVYAVVIDEATRVKKEAWYAVRSTLTATRGPIRIIGNVHGKRNWAYQLARKAQGGERDKYYSKIDAYDAADAGVIDRAEIEDARRTLPDAIFRQLYLCEPAEDEGNPFDVRAIRACMGPISENAPAAFGIDLAKSVDWTVVIGLDAQGAVCVFERYQAPWNKTIDRIKKTVAQVPALVDSTGVGDPVLESLQKDGGQNFEGYKFTQPSKQQLMEGLSVELQNGQIVIPEGTIINELSEFQYEYTKTGVRYSAPEGLHDDCVMAEALALRKLRAPVMGWGAV